MEISLFCYQCKKYGTDSFVNDMADNKPNCFIHKRCGECQFSKGIEGRSGMVGCNKLNILRSSDDFCIWNEN